MANTRKSINFQAKYCKLMSGEELVESSLHNHLVEHLNSEIVLGTITDIAVAVNWLRSTFLYIRALKNPKHYGMSPNLTQREIESKLQAMCMRELHALEKYELIRTSNFAYVVESTENGKLMARYYIAFDTMKVFMKIEGSETLPQLLELLTLCHEFQEVQLRRHERPVLNALNRHKTKESIRFPIPGKIATKTAKANVLIQAVLGSLPISDAGLQQESVKVMRLAERLLRGLTMYLGRKHHFNALSSALTLHKCSVVKMWENSALVSRQLPGIGPALSALLKSAGKNSFRDIVATDPRTLERVTTILFFV
ncbi:hypothetical protein GE061_018564 [Apolygus lucorum]|uniref:DNA 3'-5' helicase n=1 Tax=Apolygus lucorum TaxID=248454 RepID=A0A8S9XEE0_APOLU|nr:hypothetical protein GE061_018564 [Apolygus lucorum]